MSIELKSEKFLNKQRKREIKHEIVKLFNINIIIGKYQHNLLSVL